ncbi:MAG: heme-binding domain-containing protein [Aestuariibaculum sp.]
MKLTRKKIILLLVVVLVVSQFFQPDKNEGDLVSLNAFYQETNTSEEIKVILNESCNDCHSDVTRYPWYSSITPLNYWMASHVNEGKRKFNISKWSEYPVKRKDHKMEELIEMVEAGHMPLKSYTWTHTEAKLTDVQKQLVVDWAKQIRANIK